MRKMNEEIEKEQEAGNVEPESPWVEDPDTEVCAVRPEPDAEEKQISYSELTVMLCEARAELAAAQECADIRREQIEHLSEELKREQNESWILKKAIIAMVLEKFA